MNEQTYYQISFTQKFTTIPAAISYQSKIAEKHNIGTEIEITYYMPQPQYKSWVPKWIINLITKPSK